MIKKAASDAIKVFVSSRQNQEMNFDRAVTNCVLKILPKFKGWLFEFESALPDPPAKGYLTAVSRSDLLFLLIGKDVSQAVVNECKLARALGIPILAFVKNVKDRESRCQAFIAEIGPYFKYDSYNNCFQLVGAIHKALFAEDLKLTQRISLRKDAQRLRALSKEYNALSNAIGVFHHDLDDQINKIRTEKKDFIIVGEAGSGKSVLSKDLFEKYEADYEVEDVPSIIPIRLAFGEFVFQSADEIKDVLGIKNDLKDVLNFMSEHSKIALIMDGLDELIKSVVPFNYFRATILESFANNSIRCFIFCRKYEWETDPLLKVMRECDSVVHVVTPWSIADVQAVLKANSLEQNLPSSILQLLTNPFLLDLYTQLTKEIGPEKDNFASNPAELFARYWDVRVRAEGRQALGADKVKLVQYLCKEAEQNKVSIFNYDQVILFESKAASELLNNSVLVRSSRGIQYRHELLFEYSILLNKGWLSTPHLLYEFVRSSEYNSFDRPILKLCLRFLIYENEIEILKNILISATKNTNTGWIYVILDCIAKDYNSKLMNTLVFYFDSLEKQTREMRLTHFVRCLVPNKETLSFLRDLKANWIQEAQNGEFHDEIATLIDNMSPSIVKTDLLDCLIQTEKHVRDSQLKRPEAEGVWDWPSMRYAKAVGALRCAESIDWLIDICQLGWPRPRMICRDQIDWVADINPEKGAHLLVAVLGLKEDFIEGKKW